ncbi:MAG TPA: Spy/CpxP family protein refolding chaperone [Candidatus Lustribacter sp.]
MRRFVRPLAAVVTVALATAAFTAGDLALGRLTPAAAQTAPGGPQGAAAGRQRFGKMLMTLDLTDVQKGQIRSIMASARAQNKTLTDPQAKRDNMRSAFTKIEAVLTPAQRTKLHAERDAAKAQHGSAPNHS